MQHDEGRRAFLKGAAASAGTVALVSPGAAQAADQPAHAYRVRSKRFSVPAAMTMEEAVERYIRIKEPAPAK